MRWLLAVLMLCMTPALAQHNHAQYHSEYELWSSRKANGGSCCSDRDCGALKDSEVREDDGGTSVLISGQWCPVLSIHLLTRGKSPDWTVAHACILPPRPFINPCDRLMCFVEAAKF